MFLYFIVTSASNITVNGGFLYVTPLAQQLTFSYLFKQNCPRLEKTTAYRKLLSSWVDVIKLKFFGIATPNTCTAKQRNKIASTPPPAFIIIISAFLCIHYSIVALRPPIGRRAQS